MPLARRSVLLAFLASMLAAACCLPIGRADASTGILVKHSCASASVGQISCQAEILVSRRTGRPIHPHPWLIARGVMRFGATVVRAGAVGVTPPLSMTPAYLQQAYDLTYLSADRGYGDTIAIVDSGNDPNAASDLAVFRSTYGLKACTVANGCLQILNEQGQSSPLPATDWSWAQEESLDLDAVSSLCPNCKILLVEADAGDTYDLQQGISAAIATGAIQVSASWAGEYNGNPFSDFDYPTVSVLAAAGDDGMPPAGESDYPAALPNVTAVGGTSLNPDGSRNVTARGVVDTAWSDSGAGCDTDESPLPYQPATACDGRVYSDVSADADPSTGLMIYDSQQGGWLDGGGTSLSTPLVAAFEAITGVNGLSNEWAYADSSNLNSSAHGSAILCPATSSSLCNTATGYDAQMGAGAISGQVTTGAPGIAAPALAGGSTYLLRRTATHAWLRGGVYPNGEPTVYYWQFGRTTHYGRWTRAVRAGSGTNPIWAHVCLTGLRPGTVYHYRLVARNASGTSYGYDYTFRTGRSPVRRRRRR